MSETSTNETTLRLWTDGTETYSAESAADARALQVELVGEEDAAPIEEWSHICDDAPITI